MFSRKEVQGHGQGRAENHSSHKSLRWLSLHREELWPSFSRVNTAHALQQSSLFQEGEQAGTVQERSGSGTRNQSVGEGWESESQDRHVWVQMDPVAPLATLDKRPDDKRPPVIKRNTVSTVEGAEPPGPPYHLFFISVDGSILSTPRMVPEKPARRGGAPGNSQTPLPCVQISLPSKTDTSVTPGGWCRSQRAPIFILTSLRGNFPRSRISNLKSQGYVHGLSLLKGL